MKSASLQKSLMVGCACASLAAIQVGLSMTKLVMLYIICFVAQRGFPHEVYLNTKHGVEAKNYEGVSLGFMDCCR